MSKLKLSGTEKFILAFVFLIVLVGFILFQVNLTAFETYIEEDGIVEWLTVLGLLMGSFLCFSRIITLRKERSVWFCCCTLILGLFLFFAAGEEISWGQRIFNIKSSAYFVKNNAQGETNLHNLIVGGVKINRLIFSFGLIAIMGIYLLLFPILYKSSQGFRKFIDKSAIPLARLYQVIAILVLFGLTETIRHGKRAELLEAGIALLFFLVIAFPQNKYIFRKGNSISA